MAFPPNNPNWRVRQFSLPCVGSSPTQAADFTSVPGSLGALSFEPCEPAVSHRPDRRSIRIVDPPLMRFGSLQRIPAALCRSEAAGPGRSRFGLFRRASPADALRGVGPLRSFSASRTSRAHCEPHMPPSSRVIRRMISSFRCPGPAPDCLRSGRSNWRFSRQRSWDYFPSQFFSGSSDVVGIGNHGPTCRLCRRPAAGAGIRFFVPRTFPPSGGIDGRAASASGFFP